MYHAGLFVLSSTAWKPPRTCRVVDVVAVGLAVMVVYREGFIWAAWPRC